MCDGQKAEYHKGQEPPHLEESAQRGGRRTDGRSNRASERKKDRQTNKCRWTPELSRKSEGGRPATVSNGRRVWTDRQDPLAARAAFVTFNLHSFPSPSHPRLLLVCPPSLQLCDFPALIGTSPCPSIDWSSPCGVIPPSPVPD